MKKFVLWLTVFILFIHQTPQARAGGSHSCFSDSWDEDSFPSYPSTQASRRGSHQDSRSSSSASSQDDLDLLYQLLDGEVSLPPTFTVHNLPGGILRISSQGVIFRLYSDRDSVEETIEYRKICESPETLIRNSTQFSGKVEGIYEAIRQLGRDKDQSESFEAFLTLIREMVRRYAISFTGNNCRLGKTKDGKLWRMCMQTNEGSFILIHVPGNTKH